MSAAPVLARQATGVLFGAAVVAVALALLTDLVPPRPAGGVLLGCLALGLWRRQRGDRDRARGFARLLQSPSFARSLAQAGSDAALVLDGTLRISWAAPGLSAATPVDVPLTGSRLADVVHPDDAAGVLAWLTGPSDVPGPTGVHTFRLPVPGVGWRVLEAAATDLRADAEVRALVLHCRDVGARLDRERELSSLAFTDPLTGLPNRAAQQRSLAQLLDRPAGADPSGEVALLVIEVLGLREAGEQAGRDVVDVAVAEVARRLRATVRTEDQVARLSAEAFGVLAHGTGDEPDRLAARCLAVIEAPIGTDAGLVDLTAVVGVVALPPGLTGRQASDRADLAVLDARAAGPGSVRRYRPELTAARDRRDQLRRDLVGARERGELTLVWQPIVSLTDHQVAGVEALLRWRHPVHGEVQPEEFLPVAERAGLVVELQRWLLAEATAGVQQLPQHGPAPLRLGVNVSAAHLAAGTLVADVTTALAASGLSPERLVVEVPEAALDGPHVIDDVTALRLMGVHLALDDFGSGRSALPRLGRLPVDVIKLDRALLAAVDRDAYTRVVCESVVGLGASLGIDVVAEGVETTSQLAVLEGVGCGFAQGFLLSRPVPLGALTELLDAGAGRLWPGLVGRAV
ncbi:putative bifunctional diguanylate cyclase/phosphodiesterase [Modestobacter roseus]|uniref:putative bifunctional diguanylate cyclase/phosphodiesterase n=1 Tax=Modestobacter roseus TaxID=1181884 RepID=UPI0014130860|nr:bifunctional diguanylate cyclase/phosphodiesterase [Modestobacter roseus]